jgi:hypothetical protein
MRTSSQASGSIRVPCFVEPQPPTPTRPKNTRIRHELTSSFGLPARRDERGLRSSTHGEVYPRGAAEGEARPPDTYPLLLPIPGLGTLRNQ